MEKEGAASKGTQASTSSSQRYSVKEEGERSIFPHLITYVLNRREKKNDDGGGPSG